MWPHATDCAVTSTAIRLSILLENSFGATATGAKQRVQVPQDEGVANHIDPGYARAITRSNVERCPGGRGAHRPELWSDERLIKWEWCHRKTDIPEGLRMGGFTDVGKHRLSRRRSDFRIASGRPIEHEAIGVVAQAIDGR